jgi:hypothetical protein
VKTAGSVHFLLMQIPLSCFLMHVDLPSVFKHEINSLGFIYFPLAFKKRLKNFLQEFFLAWHFDTKNNSGLSGGEIKCQKV